MMNGQLVNQDVDQQSVDRLREFYDRRLVPAEKKPFLIDLRHSGGPLLGVADGKYILDVASQIASLALGFNAGAMFGAAQFLETWTGRTDTAAIRQVRCAFEELLQRILGWPRLNLQLCNSGAEAVETALGFCYRNRIHPAARRVLAFEGSFHGRMMVALASTFQPAKREPFAWPGFETSFASYPEMQHSDDVRAVDFPAGWCKAWSRGPRRDFESEIRHQFASGDDLLNRELESLLEVRSLLATGEHYAVLIEPMQCEGGDRYSSARFHNGLLNLARSFDVPLVYDEIQTGFGLGGDFFWHQKFELRDGDHRDIRPDHVVVAKKAQVGGVLSPGDCVGDWTGDCGGDFGEQYHAASLIRGFIHASMMDQFQEEIGRIEQRSREELKRLVEKFEGRILRPRACGLSFAFDFARATDLQQFVAERFQFGLLYYPAGRQSARFRFNLAFRGQWVEIAWQQIERALAKTLHGKAAGSRAIAVDLPNVESYFSFHQRFLANKLASLQGGQPDRGDVSSFLAEALEFAGMDARSVELVVLGPDNWPGYRQQVVDLQVEIYEPQRQTSIDKFDQLIAAPNSIALVVLKDRQIIAMAFAAPPVHFPQERGLRGDRYFNDPRTVYMLDLTVVPEYRGKLGRIMKQAICLVAQSRGLAAVQGRNRDRLARGMWAINLSLGSYCTRVLRDDYLDDHEHRDCLMYRCDLQWDEGPVSLSTGVEQPLVAGDLSEAFCRQQLPALVNKLTLSNFVTGEYLKQLEQVFDLLPAPLRHGYSASGISECVDKLVKALWLQRKPRRRLVTLDGSFFGHGSFLSRSLSGVPDSLFEVTRLAGVAELPDQLRHDDVLAVFIEPFGWKTGRRLPREDLLAISGICRKSGTPLVTHDSAGMFYRYCREAFLPSAVEGFMPDAGLIHLGGQMAVCFMRDEFFTDTPLMFISTWEGDLFSLGRFIRALERANDPQMPQLTDRFQRLLIARLEENGVSDYALAGGAGWFRGPLESDLAARFRRGEDGRFVCCPAPGAIREFIARLGSSEKS